MTDISTTTRLPFRLFATENNWAERYRRAAGWLAARLSAFRERSRRRRIDRLNAPVIHDLARRSDIALDVPAPDPMEVQRFVSLYDGFICQYNVPTGRYDKGRQH
jgi:hypothetical protein